MASNTKTSIDDVVTLDDLYTEIEPLSVTPGWVDREVPIVAPEPKPTFQPVHWRYRDCQPALEAAGRLVSTELAERRNFIMRNPIEGNDIATLRTLVCAYQMMLPGETARSHRHAPHALRAIIDAEGSFSIVDGEKTPMESGDIVLTPGWCWHGHGHDGDRPAYWFDGLDVPLNFGLLEAMFFEPHPDGFEKVKVVTPDSPYRFTFESTLKALETADVDPQGYFGKRIALDAPTMPTMSLYVHRWESGFRSRKQRSVANNVFVVLQGRGTTTVGGETFHWERGDTIAAPLWTWIEHQADEDAVVFCMSDEALMRYARYYRFEGA